MRAVTCFTFIFFSLLLQAQNPLSIPSVLTGTSFNLDVQSGSQSFYNGTTTATFGINGTWMSPTIIVNKGDSVTFNVINHLPVKTTMHWHGLHVAAMNDGGPHQLINPTATWSPSFKIRNNAATYFYHPHGAGQTEQQVSKGLAGLLIVKDSSEAALNLPRTYGVDDIPVIVQSKAFDVLQNIAIADDMDTALFVNGTLNPYVNVPAQVVRFRLLNASSLRSFNFGFSNSQSFYQVATDGGMLDSSITLSRLRLSPGERAEIVADFSGMSGQTIYLKSFSSELPVGIYGAASIGNGADSIPGYSANFLNGTDFNLLPLTVTAPTSNPVTSIPQALVSVIPYAVSTATVNRKMVMDTIRLLEMDTPNLAEGPFGINNKSFDIDSVNEVVYLNTTEIWTLVNKTLVAHPFHIHDVQFNVIEKSGMPPPATEKGWKDVVLVMPHDSVKFITRFSDFADNMVPYMYHCHLLHHEDDGMMGSFVVIDTTATGISESKQNKGVVFPNPANNTITVQLKNNTSSSSVKVINLIGEVVLESPFVVSPSIVLPVSELSNGIYFILLKSENNLLAEKFIKQ